jgi:hypothetical protein
MTTDIYRKKYTQNSENTVLLLCFQKFARQCHMLYLHFKYVVLHASCFSLTGFHNNKIYRIKTTKTLKKYVLFFRFNFLTMVSNLFYITVEFFSFLLCDKVFTKKPK